MAAHHRQNTAGRRKVQVWRPGSTALATLPSGRVPPRAGGRLSPRPAGFDGWRMAGRGATARGVGPRRQRPEAVAGGLGARALRAVSGKRCPEEPPSPGTGPAAASWACCPLTYLCSQPPSSGAVATRRRRPRGNRGWVRLGSEGPCGGVAGPGRTWELCAGRNDRFPSLAVGFASPPTPPSRPHCASSSLPVMNEFGAPHSGCFGVLRISLVRCALEFCLLLLGWG